MQPYYVEAGFPVSGLAEVAPFSDQEAGTSPDMLNLLPFDAKGRLRGGRRPGLTKYSEYQINGLLPVQCMESISATYVKPVLGDGTVAMNGNDALTTGMAFRANDGSGTITNVESAEMGSHTHLGSTFGPDGKCYVVAYTTTAVKLLRIQTDATVDYTASIFTAGSSVSSKQMLGLCADEDTVYLWYKDIADIGEGIMRLNQSDGSNRDSVTDGVWIRAEDDATNIERVFGGVSGCGWDVIGTVTHSMMVTYLGYLVVVGAPDLSTTPSSNQLVVYVINTKTGIPDAVSDLGIDGTSSSNDRGIFIDLAIGLDGFIYVLYKDEDQASSTSTVTYIRKIAIDGTAIWEIEYTGNPTTAGAYSLCWVPKRNVLAVCGNNVFGTGGHLLLIDPDAKGFIEYQDLSVSRNMVRCDADGSFYFWKNGSSNTIAKFDTDFVQVWDVSDPNTDQARGSLNAYYNAGNDETGSTRYQELLAISGGTLVKVETSGNTPVTGGASFSASARVIYGAPFGVLCFFADGEDHFYYDAVQSAVLDWSDNLVYGALPADLNGGFKYLEVWNDRVLAFGLTNDPNNYYFSAKGDPFDWKLQQGVAGAAINGTLSPAKRFPEKLVGAIPYNNDILIMCGDHSLYQMTLDPAVDAQLDLITDKIGMAPGRAWCKDGMGGVYFFGNSGGMYKLSLDSPPVRISNRTIDDRFTDVEIAEVDIQMQWDQSRQGVWVMFHPHSNAAATQYFFDIRTEGFFPVKFANPAYNPVCSTILDRDNPKDAKVMFGNSDGYVRYLDDAAKDDDGTLFERYFVLGPWTAQSGSLMNVMVEEMDVAVGNGSFLKAEVLVGPDAETVITDRRVAYATKCEERRRNGSIPRISGRSVALKLSTQGDQNAAFEGVRMKMRDQRSL